MVENILERIPKPIQGERVVVGIDGLSRSGKTTFVELVKEYLNQENIQVHIFHLDDYIVEKKRRYHTGNEEWYEYYHLQWDVRWVKENLLNNLKGAKELNLHTYDADTDTLLEHCISLPETGFIILEGVFLQRKEWRDYFDFMIYLDCPREKRFARESKETQQKLNKFLNRYWKAENYYLETILPKQHADFILPS